MYVLHLCFNYLGIWFTRFLKGHIKGQIQNTDDILKVIGGHCNYTEVDVLCIEQFLISSVEELLVSLLFLVRFLSVL